MSEDISKSGMLKYLGNASYKIEHIPITGEVARMRLDISKEGFGTISRSDLAFAESNEVDLGEIALDPQSVPLVSVVDIDTKQPIPGATVWMVPPIFRKRESRVTDKNGEARVPLATGERCQILASHPQYALSTPIELIGTPGTDEVVTVYLSHGGSVTAVVLDENGHPVANQQILRCPSASIEKAETYIGGHGNMDLQTTNEAGAAHFERLSTGKHRFRVVPRSVEPPEVDEHGERSTHDFGWHTVDVMAGSSLSIYLTAPATGELFGMISESGVPLVDAELFLLKDGQLALKDEAIVGDERTPITHTNSEGAYRILALPVDDYLMRIYHHARAFPTEVSARLAKGKQRLDVDLSIAQVGGRVVDPRNVPTAGVHVLVCRVEEVSATISEYFRLREWGLSRPALATTTTDANGKYLFRGVPERVALMVVLLESGVQIVSSDPFTVAPGQTAPDISLSALPAGSLEIQVVPGDGSLNIELAVDFDGQPQRVGSSRVGHVTPGNNGTIKMECLTPGRWKVRFLDPLRTETTYIDVAAAEVTRISLDVTTLK
jgi:hypothetical protein